MRAYAIVDLQFGSTGKGLLAGYLARKRMPDAVVCAFGPNSGHTFIDGGGRKFVHIMVPMGALSPNCEKIFYGPGSVVHPDLLLAEYRALPHQPELLIHENAAVVLERHREQEAAGLVHVGSTMKGTGAALVEKIMRKGNNIAKRALLNTPLEGYVVSVEEYNDNLDEVKLLQIEGAQGFSLSVHHRFWPYTTSRDCTIAQLLADCAVPPPNGNDGFPVYGVARTYPIRVANRYAPDGTMIGFSGPWYHDQEEIDWEDIGQKAELTTVTKLPRRIFTFSAMQVQQAIRMNAVDAVFLNFINYCQGSSEIDDIVAKIESGPWGAPVRWTGSGPTECDVIDLGGK